MNSTSSTSSDALVRIGLNHHFRALLAQAPPELLPVRIVARHRSGWEAHDGTQVVSASASPGELRRWRETGEEPVVGDWCLLRREGDGSFWIEQLLPRQNFLSRGREEQGEQALVANVDTALLVMGCDGNYNPSRLERFLLLVRGGGLMPVVVLSKADLAADVDDKRAEVQKLVGPGGVVLTGDVRDAAMCAQLQPWLGAGQTLVLLGSSGVGKSTLTNSLLGSAEEQATGAVSAMQDRGRHTTTTRRMLLLPGGACVIDTPGLRELQLSGAETLGAGAFTDIVELAVNCRFADCKHEREPGCAVVGAVPPERLANYHKLARELAATQRNAVQQKEQKQKDKVQSRALRRFYKQGRDE